MKSVTFKAKMEELGITGSHSRPRVSNDNPYSESLFKTMKFCPQWPAKGFEDLEAVRVWVNGFVSWYNEEHCHSGIRFVTPHSATEGTIS
ncbi:MAG: transposase [Pseudomonadales bacterium]|nr:transposase [Pseudomonadales bacterium]